MNTRIFTPMPLSPTSIADRMVKRYFDEGSLMPGVESTPVEPEQAKYFGDSYQRAWDENRAVDNQGNDLDDRVGHIHTVEGRYEKFESYSGDNQQGEASTLFLTSHEDQVTSMDRRELRATAKGWDYVTVQVQQSGNINATATHIDRHTGEGTEQVWNLRL